MALVFLEDIVTDVVDVYIPLPIVNYNNYYPPPGSTTYVLGWGAMESDGAAATELMTVDLQVISNEDCENAEYGGNNYNRMIYDDMICTTSNGGQDACQGDSGGPLIIRDDNGPGGDIIVGVVSWGIGCGVMPGVYSRASMGYDWIRSTVCEKSKYPPTRLCAGLTLKPSTSHPTTHKPTDTPTQSPSATPSTMPTTKSPTTHKPTDSPTQLPSATPSTMPSTKGPTTHKPTDSPNQSPSATPSTMPKSKSPTTDKPSDSPTTMPKSTPSTESPTKSKPTKLPTTSDPTKLPATFQLTSSPIVQPTVKLSPTTSEPTKLPTTSLTTNPVVNKWYADYSEAWMGAGCTNVAPYPTYAQLFDSQLACCNGAFESQTSNACIRSISNFTTLKLNPSSTHPIGPSSLPTKKSNVPTTITISDTVQPSDAPSSTVAPISSTIQSLVSSSLYPSNSPTPTEDKGLQLSNDGEDDVQNNSFNRIDHNILGRDIVVGSMLSMWILISVT